MTEGLSARLSDDEQNLRDRTLLADLRAELAEALATTPTSPNAFVAYHLARRRIVELECAIWWRQQMRDLQEVANAANVAASDFVIRGQWQDPDASPLHPPRTHPFGWDAWLTVVDGQELIFRNRAARDAYFAARERSQARPSAHPGAPQATL